MHRVAGIITVRNEYSGDDDKNTIILLDGSSEPPFTGADISQRSAAVWSKASYRNLRHWIFWSFVLPYDIRD